jgi:glycosyltransferase involved in cell wall biosynthesis
MMTLNILLTVHQFLPEYSSGTEILTFNVAKEFIRRGHRVSVLTGLPAKQQLSDDKPFDEYKIDGIDVFRFHNAYVRIGDQTVATEVEYNNRFAARYFALLLERIKPDIVHFFHLNRLGAGLIDVASGAAIPAYYTPTDFWSVCPTSQLLLYDGRMCRMCRGPSRYGGNCVRHVASLTRGRRVARILRFVPNTLVDVIVKLTISDMLPKYPFCYDVAAMGRRKSFNVTRLNALRGIISPTRIMSEMLIRNGVDGRLITQSAYGIDLVGYRSQIRKVPETGAVTFGYIGTLAPHKGCHVLIDAFNRMGQGRAKLCIYGNPTEFPNYFDDLQRRATGIDSIEFRGTFPNDRITEVLAGLDVLIVPSIWYENAPLVIYSALAAKCPVVASDFPGMSEVVRDGWNGLTFPAGDIQSLHAQLTRLVNDSTLIESLSANCSLPKSTGEYVDELLSLYANRHSVAAGCGEIADGQTIEPSAIKRDRLCWDRRV